MQIPLITTHFDGGISSNSKAGLPNACTFSRNLSIYDDSDSVSLNPKPIKDSGAIVVDLVKWLVDATPYNTNRYAYGDAGHIYKITSSNVWSDERTVSGGAGQGLGVLADHLFYTTATTLGHLYPLSNSPAFTDDLISDGVNNIDVSQTLSGQTYTTPTSIAETATARIALTSALSLNMTKDPLKAVNITLTAKGTGNVTVTLHDVNNVSVGSVTVANASLANGSNTFTFATPLRINLGSDYHLHVTSTVADTTVTTGTTANLTTATFSTVFGILVSDSDYHPIIQHTNGVTGTIVIGNGQYMAVYDLDTYDPNAIMIEPGYKIRGWTRENEFIVAYAWKGTNIDSFEEGRLFYWDGVQPYYNYSKPVPDGSPNAMIASKNRTLSILGSSGGITLGTEPFLKIQPAPKLVKGKKIEVLPGAITNWQGRVHFGYSNTDDATGIEQGVYEYGNQSDRPISNTSVSTESLNFAYAPSTTIVSPTAFKIGCVEGLGKDLYISYKDNTSYYVDRVAKTNDPCATGSWESVIINEGVAGGGVAPMPLHTKNALKMIITFKALPTGCTIIPKYRIERATSFTSSPRTAVAGDTRVEHIFNGTSGMRYKEIEYGFDITATVNYPIITSITFIFDPLEKEAIEN